MYGIFTYTFSIEINNSWTGTYTSFMDPVTYMGVSLNGGTPKTPQNDQCLVGKPMVVGYHRFRKPSYSRYTWWFVGSNSPKDILRVGLFWGGVMSPLVQAEDGEPRRKILPSFLDV